MRPPNLILIPGMGVDARLFEPQRALPVKFTVPPWPRVAEGDTLETYAARFADEVGPCDAIGGVSFGGMLAQAMAAKVGARLVIGIATARNGRQIPSVLRFAQAVTEFIPSPSLSPSFLGALPAKFHKDVMGMIRDARLDVVRAGSKMILDWKGSMPPCPTRFIHGDRDVVIRHARVKPDRLVRGGGHLVNLTHPKAVNAFIVECLVSEGLVAYP